ncbi:MAG: hypothetical protein AAB426_12870 [Myxococcota bacterium]
MSHSHLLVFCVAATCGVLSPSSAIAWSERGHDVVTQAAVRLVEARMGEDRRLTEPLVARSGMLGHLSNVPDIVWRAGDKATVLANSPTHYVSLDLLTTLSPPTLASLPMTIAEAERRAAAQGKRLHPDIGTLPFRLAQLVALTEDALVAVPTLTADADTKALEAPVNQALLMAGLLSHYVADTTMPDHVCSAHDGWQRGQGGIHAYFEGALVDALGQELTLQVLSVALASEPYAHLLASVDAPTRGALARDPIRVAFLLALDSMAHREPMHALDQQLAVLEPSRDEDVQRKPASRRPARTVAPAFAPMLVERLAMAADTLASLWVLAWERAGRPDLRLYQSYVYPVAPDYVPNTYLDASGTVSPHP